MAKQVALRRAQAQDEEMGLVPPDYSTELVLPQDEEPDPLKVGRPVGVKQPSAFRCTGGKCSTFSSPSLFHLLVFIVVD